MIFLLSIFSIFLASPGSGRPAPGPGSRARPGKIEKHGKKKKNWPARPARNPEFPFHGSSPGRPGRPGRDGPGRAWGWAVPPHLSEELVLEVVRHRRPAVRVARHHQRLAIRLRGRAGGGTPLRLQSAAGGLGPAVHPLEARTGQNEKKTRLWRDRRGPRARRGGPAPAFGRSLVARGIDPRRE